MWRNDTRCKYMFMFPLNNLAHKGLTPDSAKLSPWSMTDGKVGGPAKNKGGTVKLLYVIIFEILKSCQRCILVW